jgi:hypothetical protein
MAVDELSHELQRVMQVVSDTAELKVNLHKECFIMYCNADRIVNGLVSLNVQLRDDEVLKDVYEEFVMAQKSCGELKKTLEAIDELKSINCTMELVKDDLYAYSSELSQRCAKIAGVIKGDFVPLPSKIIDDMSAMMNRLLRAKKERSSPTGSTTVEPPLLPPYGNQMFAAASMFSPPGYILTVWTRNYCRPLTAMRCFMQASRRIFRSLLQCKMNHTSRCY